MTNQPKPVMGKLRIGQGIERTLLISVDNCTSVALTSECDGPIEHREANAAELVRRWNCHDDLVAAIKALLGQDNPPWGKPSHVDLGQAATMARAALKHAME